MNKVGLLIIASNKYIRFAQDLISSADEHFLQDQDVTYFLFTDREDEIQSERKVVKLKVEHKEWPWMTLGRYRIFTTYQEELSKMDYLYYSDADMLFKDKVGDEILSTLVGTAHPGCYLYKPRGDPETRPESLACIHENEDFPYSYYMAGGFNGGTASEYLKMARVLADNIDTDFKNDIIALWHDESHMNRYFIDNPPTLALDPGYCFGEGHPLPFKCRLLALNKDHHEIRS
tara:strand:+ start:1359 stop:2054 length:696 start_codon:yes stop_codon:yes gene_type:complete